MRGRATPQAEQTQEQLMLGYTPQESPQPQQPPRLLPYTEQQKLEFERRTGIAFDPSIPAQDETGSVSRDYFVTPDDIAATLEEAPTAPAVRKHVLNSLTSALKFGQLQDLAVQQNVVGKAAQRLLNRISINEADRANSIADDSRFEPAVQPDDRAAATGSLADSAQALAATIEAELAELGLTSPERFAAGATATGEQDTPAARIAEPHGQTDPATAGQPGIEAGAGVEPGAADTGGTSRPVQPASVDTAQGAVADDAAVEAPAPVLGKHTAASGTDTTGKPAARAAKSVKKARKKQPKIQPERPEEQSEGPGYSLPRRKDEWSYVVDGRKIAAEDLTRRQQLVVDAVRDARLAGLVSVSQIEDFVADKLNVSDQVRQLKGDTGGSRFGYDVYLAGQRLDKINENAENQTIGERLKTLKQGDRVGTLYVYQNRKGKQFRGVTVTSVGDGKISLSGALGGKRFTYTTDYSGFIRSLEEAVKRGIRARKDPDLTHLLADKQELSLTQQTQADLDRQNQELEAQAQRQRDSTAQTRAKVERALGKERAAKVRIVDDAGNAQRQSRSPQTQSNYEARVDALFNGAAANRVGAKVLDSSDLLGLLGHEGKPVYLKESKLLAGRDNHPRMTADVWKKIPQWLDNPAAVFDSDTAKGRLVFIAPETVQGAEVRLVIEPNADVANTLNAHLLLNAYDTPEARTPYMRWINSGLLRYADKKMFPDVLVRTAGLRLPSTALQNKPGTRKILTEKNLRGYRREQGIDGSRRYSRSAQRESLLNRRARKATAIGAEGFYDPDTDTINLIPQNIRAHLHRDGGKVVELLNADERLAFVAWHEMTHRALAAKTSEKDALGGIRYGKEYASLLRRADSNSYINKLRKAIQADRAEGEQPISDAVAVEEALAETRAAMKVEGGFASNEKRYDVHAPLAVRKGLAGTIQRFVDGVRRIIRRLTGKDASSWSDTDVFNLLRGLDDFDTAAVGAGDGSVRQDMRHSFAGENARTADVQTLEQAKERVAAGADAETVRQQTGWFKGADGKWRFEIDDSQAQMLLDKQALLDRAAQSPYNSANLRIDELIAHDALFDAYPQLRDVTVFFDGDTTDGGYSGGMFVPEDNELVFGAGIDPNKIKRLVLHELQHAVQREEGFARGGSSSAQGYAQTVRMAQDAKQSAGRRKNALEGARRTRRLLAEADRGVREVLLFEAAGKLREYAARERPSAVLRHIRNNLGVTNRVLLDIHNAVITASPEQRDAVNALRYEQSALPGRRAKDFNDKLRTLSLNAANAFEGLIRPDALKDMRSNGAKQRRKALQQQMQQTQTYRRQLGQAQAEYRASAELLERIQDMQPYEAYHALAGEVEARNVETRMDYSAQQRRDTPPQATEDVPAQQQVVDTRDGFVRQGVRYSIGRRARERYENQILKRNPNMSPEHLKESLDFLHELEDNKENTKAIKVAVKWLSTDAIRLPFAMDNVRKAIALSEKHKIDPMQFNSPMDIINKYYVDVEYGKPVNPDKLAGFSNRRTVDIGDTGEHVTIYDVEDSDVGQRAVTRVGHQHFGYSNKDNRSKCPWCLASFTRRGNPTASAERHWFDTYNSVGKKIAFKDGKLIAFMAHDKSYDGDLWWSLDDEPSNNLPLPDGRYIDPDGSLSDKKGGKVLGYEAMQDEAMQDEAMLRVANEIIGTDRFRELLEIRLENGGGVSEYFLDELEGNIETATKAEAKKILDRKAETGELDKEFDRENYDLEDGETFKSEYDRISGELLENVLDEYGDAAEAIYQDAYSKAKNDILSNAYKFTDREKINLISSSIYVDGDPIRIEGDYEDYIKEAGDYPEMRFSIAPDSRLPMGFESRMERAEAMGFDTDTVYGHNSREEKIERILPEGVPGRFNQFYGLFALRGSTEGAYHKHAHQYLIKGEPATDEDLAAYYEENPERTKKIFEPYAHFEATEEGIEAAIESFIYSENISDESGEIYKSLMSADYPSAFVDSQNFRARLAAQAGFNAVEVFDEFNGETVMLLPGNGVRNINAAFDPEQEQKDNLYYSIAPTQPEIDFRAAEVRDADGDLLAPNGKKSKLTERQWHQVRSPDFKNWFGDWELAGHRAFLDGKAVASMKGDEVPVFDKVSKLAQWADDYFAEKVGRSVQHEQLGAITLNKRSAKDSLGHGGGTEGRKAKALWMLPEAVPKMRVVSDLGDTDGRQGFVLAAPVEMGGSRYVLSAIVKRDSNTQRLYVHEMDLEKELQALSTDASAKMGELNSEQLGVMNSVLRDIYSVKPEDVSKVTDPETGEPMVVYHGTKADRFWTFLDSMLGSNTGAASARKGHFFAKSKRTAAAYQASSYTKEVFWQREAIGTQVAFDWFLQDVINPLVRRIDNDPTLWEYVQRFVKKHNITDGAKHPIISMLMAIEPNPGRMRDVRADDFASAEKLEESGQQRKLGHEHVFSLIDDGMHYFVNESKNAEAEPEMLGSLYMKEIFDDSVKELERLGENKLLPDLKRAQKRLNKELHDTLIASAIDAADQTTGTDGENIYHEFLNIRNPLVHDFKGEHYREVTYNDLLKRAREEGRSGAILRNTYDGGGKDDIFVAFNPSDIKSATDNIGTFDPENDDTRYSIAPTQPEIDFRAPEVRDADGDLLAPNGKKSKLTERQWHQVRSPQFKNWFGDWEKSARIDKLRKSKDVVISEDDYKGKYKLDYRSARQWIKDNLRNKALPIDDTGETVVIERDGSQKVTSHDQDNQAHLKSIAAIPEMLKNAVFVTQEKAGKNKKYEGYRYYVTGVEIDNESYTAKLVVGVDSQGRKFYDHRLTQIEKNRLIDHIDQSARGFKRAEDLPLPPDAQFKDTRLAEILQVGDVSKVIEPETGEPMVVYHGSRAIFYKFAEQETSKGADRFGSGFYFSNSYDDARGYGREVASAFLNIKNPMIGPYRDTGGSALTESDIEKLIKASGKKLTEAEEFGVKNYLLTKSVESLLFPEDGKTFRSLVQSIAGFDGFAADVYEGTHFVAYRPNQIKSATDNIGTFDPENDDIRYSIAPLELAGDTVAESDAAPAQLRALTVQWAKKRYSKDKGGEPAVVRNEDPAFGKDVTVAWQGVKHAIAGKGALELRLIPHVEQILQKARHLATKPDKAGRKEILAVHELTQPVSLDGGEYDVGVVVREREDGQFFYDQFILRDAPPRSRTSGAASSGELSDGLDSQPSGGGEPIIDDAGDVDNDFRYSVRPTSIEDALRMTADGRAFSSGAMHDIRARDWQGLRNRLQKAAEFVNDKLHDSMSPASRWIRRQFDADTAAELDGALYRGAGIQQALMSRAMDDWGDKVLAGVKALAIDNRATVEDAMQSFGYWLSARYAPRANQRLIEKDRAAVAAGELTQQELQDRIDSVHAAQPDAKPVRGVAGGMNNAAAAQMMRNVEGRYDRARLEALAEQVYDLNAWKLTLDIETGKVDAQMAAQFLNRPQIARQLQRFQDMDGDVSDAQRRAIAKLVRSEYVPLTGSPHAEPETDAFGTGTSMPNVSKDKALDGRMDSVAEDGLSATFAALAKSATHAGFQPFKRALNEAYEQALSDRDGDVRATHDALGMSRTNEFDVSAADDVVIYRDKGKAYVFRLHDRAAMDAIKRNNVERRNRLLDIPARLTGWFSYAATQLNLMFAPANFFRDVWEKSSGELTGKQNLPFRRPAAGVFVVCCRLRKLCITWHASDL